MQSGGARLVSGISRKQRFVIALTSSPQPASYVCLWASRNQSKEAHS